MVDLPPQQPGQGQPGGQRPRPGEPHPDDPDGVVGRGRDDLWRVEDGGDPDPDRLEEHHWHISHHSLKEVEHVLYFIVEFNPYQLLINTLFAYAVGNCIIV